MILHQDTLLLDRVTMLLWAVTIVLAGDAEALDRHTLLMDRVTMLLWAVTIILAGNAEALD
jgi:hypothetical protein